MGLFPLKDGIDPGQRSYYLRGEYPFVFSRLKILVCSDFRKQEKIWGLKHENYYEKAFSDVSTHNDPGYSDYILLYRKGNSQI